MARRYKPGRKSSTKSKRRMLFGTRTRRPCAYCGALLFFKDATVDHVKAISRGGYDRLKNCVIACRACNRTKRSLSVDEFLLRVALKAHAA